MSIILTLLVAIVGIILICRYTGIGTRKEGYISTGTVNNAVRGYLGLTRVHDTAKNSMVFMNPVQHMRHYMQEQDRPLNLSQTCKNFWSQNYSQYLHKMVDGSPIPQDLRDRLESECSCGNYIQYMDDVRYYYFDYSRLGWGRGSRYNDVANAYTSANVRNFGAIQQRNCGLTEIVRPRNPPTLVHRRLRGSYARNIDLTLGF